MCWYVLLKGKGKADPLQARRGPEGSRKLRLPDFVTMAQDGGRLSALRTVCISTYIKSVLRYKCLIFDTYHPDTMYLREQGYEDPYLFIEAKRGRRAKKFVQH